MKNVIRIILSGLVLLMLVSCTEEGVFEKPVFANIKPYYLSVDAAGVQELQSGAGTATFTVEAQETGWKITGMPAWFSITPTEGNATTQVKVTYNANASTDAGRTAVLTITSTDKEWNYSATFNVSQVRSLCYAQTEQTDITVDGKASTTNIPVLSNTDAWTVSCTSQGGWLQATKSADSKSFNVSVIPNTLNVSRTGIVQLITTDSKHTFTVTQRPANITSSLDEVQFGVKGGASAVTVNSEASWSAQTASSWLNITPSTGSAGSVSISIQAQPNYSLTERKGYIYLVLSQDSKIEIPVTQECVSFSLSSYAMQFGASAQDKQITVTSNVGWAVAEGHSTWLSFSPNKADESGNITVSALENPETTQRSGSFSVTPSVIDYPKQVDVTQSGHSFDLDSTALNFTDKESSAKLTIESDGTWSATTTDDWITLSPASGTGNGEVTVMVTENTQADERTGSVKVSLGVTSYTVPVIQQGKFMNVSGGLFNLTSKGGSVDVTISTNDGWSASIPDSVNWITLSDKSGEGDCNLKITVAENKSTTARNAKITVTPTNLKPYVISIEQAARYMRVPVSTLNFFSKGGTSDNIQVETDGVVSAASAEDWITVNTIENGLFTITVQSNPNWFERSGTVTVLMTDLDEGELKHTITITQDEFSDPLVIEVSGVKFNMIPVRGGTFTMGAAQATGIYEASETPAHQVTLSDYYIGETEVTQALWLAVMGKNPSVNTGDLNLPVDSVTWNACLKFVNRLSEITERKFRMPTEAEWEYAARGGAHELESVYSGSSKIDDVAWFIDNSTTITHKVKQLAPNELGIYDMSGNVQEWCLDWYADYTTAAVSNPSGPDDGSFKVNRGGFANSYAKECRVTWRGLNAAPQYTNQYMGLRVVLSDIEYNTTFSADILPIPDANFKTALVSSYDRDGDLEISYDEALRITRIDAPDKGITSVAGIEQMPNVTYINLKNNLLTSIDVSGCSGLQTLNLNNNQLTSLDVSACNQLTALDCTENASLTVIYVKDGFNALSYPNFKKDAGASYLERNATVIEIADANFRTYIMANFDTDGNGYLTANEAAAITTINISGQTISSVNELKYMPALTSLTLSGCTSIDSINLTVNTALQTLNLSGNNLSKIDVSGLTALTSLNLSNNSLTGPIDITHNTALNSFNVTGNASVDYIYVWDGFESSEYAQFSKDNTARYVILAISMPDAAFRSYILDNFDTDANGQLSQLEAEAITSISVSGQSISSVQGIKYMTALESVNLSNNSITELDLSAASGLTTLNVKGNSGLKMVTVPSTFTKALFDAAQYDRQTYIVPAGNARVFTANGVSFTMITVPGGTFTMGATTEQEADAADAEKPAHQVTLTGFSIGQTEVTQALWVAVMGSNPSVILGDDLPADQLSWSECREFISRLNTLTGQSFRFATEAEWEFAARGGNWSKGYKYSGGDDPDEVAWYSLSRGSHFTHNVATSYPNELGLYDMSGNVIEWCMDWNGSYTDAAQTDPTGAPAGERHILRGGSWNDDAVNCRVSARASAKDQKYQDIGLRIVLGGADVPDSWYGQWITVPDESFAEYLLTMFDTDEDDHLSVGEAEAIKTVNVAGYGDVSSLTGIEYMTSMTQLYCNSNLLTSIDVSKNTELKALVCANNNLTTLDISKNTKLTTLNAIGNASLTTIYVWQGFKVSDYPNFNVPSGVQFVVKQ